TEVFEAPPQYVVGDRIKGRLFVDRRLAQPRSDSSPNRVTYISFDPAFVGDFWPSSGDGFDRVDVSDEQSIPGIERPIDGSRVFTLSARLYDFLDGTGLDQSFELTSADVDEPNEDLSGGFRYGNLGPFAFVSFVLDRLTVKPGHCSAP